MVLILLLGFFSFFHTVFADQITSEKAEAVLNRVAYHLPSPSIIGKREWEELQLDRLVTILDRTQTSFGRWGLVQLLHPIADTKELERRKKIITFLVDHEQEMNVFREQFEQVRKFEKSLLAYWDKDDWLNRNAEQFYYSGFGIKELNKSSLALNASTIMEMFSSGQYFFTMLAFGGLSAEFSRWLYSDQEKFDIVRGLRAGLELPLRHHSTQLYQLIDNSYAKYGYKDYVKAFGLQGSWGDRYNLLSKGHIVDAAELGLPKILSSIVPSFGKLGAFIGATVPTLFFDYQWGSAIFSVGKRILFMNHTLNALQKRVSDVAQCIKALKKLRTLVVKHVPELAVHFSDEHYDSAMNDFIKKLLTPRFLQSSRYIYSRGHVLTMHLEIWQTKRELILLLHSLAILDAYCSIAQLYKENQKQPVVFSFAKFVESSKPFFDYQDAWLALLPPEEAIVNDLALGGDKPGKIIITGPNGGGKSTILKTEGIAAILAQSWLIVPAKKARQTLFSAIRTGIAPQEDVERGLSSFTATKKIMEELLEDIQDSDQHHQMLVLIDEPYSRTVDAQSARRIYQFGKDIAGFTHALVALATHVKKPIFLEKDTGGIFGNYQVKIEELSPGIFKRLFKLEQGPALWWFEDEDKASRFIDWIDVSNRSEA